MHVQWCWLGRVGSRLAAILCVLVLLARAFPVPSTFAAGPPVAIFAAPGTTPQNTPINTAFPVLLQAVVVDGVPVGNGVPGVAVTFTAPATGPSGTFTGGSTTAVAMTDATGLATAPAFVANGIAGSYVVTASVSGVTFVANFDLTNTSVLPVITNFAPLSGTVGTAVTINGTNLAGPSSVTFNGAGAMIVSSTATAVVAKVPAAASTGPIAVTTAAGTAISATNFIVLPKINAFTPTSGVPGTAVTITGSALKTGATHPTVKFGGTVATVTSSTPTSVVAGVPNGAASGPQNISVTTADGTATSATDFTVLQNTPPGSNVVVVPVDSVTGTPAALTVTFSNVIAGGVTSLTTSPSGAPPPTGFKLGTAPVYYDLTTTAVFSGSVEVCLTYDASTFGNEAALAFFHFEATVWVNRTTTLDTAADILCAAVTSLSPFAAFELAGRPVVAVTNESDGSLAIIDPDKNMVTAMVAVGRKPGATTFFDLLAGSFVPPARLYVLERGTKGNAETDDRDTDADDPDATGNDDDRKTGNRKTDAVRVLDRPGFAADVTIPVGRGARGLALKPDGTQLWVANSLDDSLSIIDRAHNSVITEVPLGRKAAGVRRPLGVAFSADSRFAYVVARDTGHIVVIDASGAVSQPKNAVVGSLKVGRRPVALAVHAQAGLLYVVNRGEDAIAVVDISAPHHPVLLARVAVGSAPEAIALDGDRLYVANGRSRSVSILDLGTAPASPSVIATIEVGAHPTALAVVPPGIVGPGAVVYVANRGDSSVSVIDGESLQVMATIQVGDRPSGVAAGLLPQP
jgi:YVTN family beta-propeller protein